VLGKNKWDEAVQYSFQLTSNLTAIFSPSKHRVDSKGGYRQPSAVKRLSILLATLVLAQPLSSQAPVSSFLWQLADQTLATPAALAPGATGMFWNPAGIAHLSTTAVGVQVVRAPNIIGIDGLVAGISQRLTTTLWVGLSVGRLDMRDIIRTTSSPVSELGSIPIYDQMAAIAVAASAGPVSLGFTVRGHDSRFDIQSDNGLTTDVGIVVTPSSRLTLAASTHLQSFELKRDDGTRYLGAAEYDVGGFTLGTDSIAVSLAYGFSSGSRGLLDHTFGLELLVSSVVKISALSVLEDGASETAWRPTTEISLVLGKYIIGVARSEGIGGIGPSYRINFDLILKP
jgi:hypothetical protein